MTTLIFDDEPKYLAYWQARGVDTAATLESALELIEAGNYDLVIVSARMLATVPALVTTGIAVEVATSRPAVSEAIAAYRAGARDYRTKDFR